MTWLKTSIADGSLRNNLLVHVLILLTVVFFIEGTPVPDINESLYLLLPLTLYDPTFLANEWCFSAPWYAHYFFDLLVGPFIKLTSIEFVGWVGRLCCWVLLLRGLLRLGLRFEIPLWMASFAIGLWLYSGQALVAEEWMIGGFEAKCISYIMVLYGINVFLDKKERLAAILFGLSFCFHPAVGFFAIVAFGLTLVALKHPFKNLFTIVLLTFLCSLPMIVVLAPQIFGDSFLSRQDYEFLVLSGQPMHLDPFSWVRRDVLAVFVLLAFNVFYSLENRDKYELQFFLWFQLGLALFFLLGMVARSFQYYSFLVYMPFRLFPLFTPLLFLYAIMRAYHLYGKRTLQLATAITGFLALMCLANPFGQVLDKEQLFYHRWTETAENGLEDAYGWIRDNTPNGAVILAPPWRADTWYLTRRAQVVTYWAFPWDHRYGQWRARVQAVLGDVAAYREKNIALQDYYLEMDQHYNGLSEEEVEQIGVKYEASYFVTRNDYPYPLLFGTEGYKVYALNKQQTVK